MIVCGGGLVHDCGTSRAIGYFLETLVLLALFAKKVRHNSSLPTTGAVLQQAQPENIEAS